MAALHDSFRRSSGRTTIHDVAARAGVSIKTVSRVLNDEPSVRAETRSRVRDAMLSLNYQPSLPARTLAGRRSNLVALVYENPSASYVFDVQSGSMDMCRQKRMRLLVQSCNDLGDLLIEEVLSMVDQTHIDGLVLTPPLSSNRDLIAALDAKGLPFVRVAPDARAHGSPRIEMDDRAAAQEMTEYLAGLGHRRIGFIEGHPTHTSSRLRIEGFRAGIAASGLAPSDQPVEQGFNSFDSGVAAARKLLGRKPRPTAIFASNDDMAAGAIFAAREAGLDVPGALSIAGFDDTQLASITYPPLTTIHQPSYDMASVATALLIDLIRGGEVVPVTRLDHVLVKRGSTAAPGKGGTS